jgi:hypothetical protein
MSNYESAGWNEYIKQIQNVLSSLDLQDKVLLEIAPGECNYAKIYGDAGLRKYIGVEPNKSWLDSAKKKLEYYNAAEEYEFVYSTYEDYQLTCQIDVLYSSGLLYHLASPIHYLETIANYNPEYIIIEHPGEYDNDIPFITDESVSIRHAGGLTLEKVNKPGMRMSEVFEDPPHDIEIYSDKKTVPLNMFLSCRGVAWCLEKMGYSLEEYIQIGTTEKSKQENCVMRFKREHT